jgi:transcription initiation factor TFIIB
LREVEVNIPFADPINFRTRIGGALELSGTTQHKAAEIIREAQKMGITAGKDPAGLSRSSDLRRLVARKRTQDPRKRSHRPPQVTEVTVRNRYKELMKGTRIEVPLQVRKGALLRLFLHQKSVDFSELLYLLQCLP